MLSFPQDFAPFLIPVAILEGASGVAKSKYGEKVFLAGLFVEIVCASIQSAALIATVIRASYSAIEIAAACFTVFIDAVLLIHEAWLVGAKLSDIERPAVIRSLWESLFAGTCLTIAGLPIIIAKVVKKRLYKRFRTSVSRSLMLALSIIPGFVGVGACLTLSKKDDKMVGISVVSFFSIIPVSLALGIIILLRNDYLSLSFLVIANLYPALVTYVNGFALFVSTEISTE